MSAQELAARCRGRWTEIVSHLAGQPAMLAAIERGPRRFGFCPVHGGVHGDAFRIFKDFEETGGAVCNTCGKFGNGFALLKWLNGWNFAQAAEMIESHLDGYRVRPRPVAAPKLTPAAKPRSSGDGPTLERLEQLWSEAHPLTSDAAEPLRKYLASRMLSGIPALESVRCHPDLIYYTPGSRESLSSFPTMLVRLHGPDGRLVALHRTYLTADGKKAPVDPVKKLMLIDGCTASGASIRLLPATVALGITEGIENALAVHLATGMPVWAAGSSSLLGAAFIPTFVRQVFIWGDLDPPAEQKDGTLKRAGRDAAEKLAARLRSEFRRVQIILPKPMNGAKHVDWNDVWRSQGTQGFPTISESRTILPTAVRLLHRLFGHRVT